MALMQPWLGALLVLLIVVAGAAGWRRWRRTALVDAVLVANTSRMRQLPSYTAVVAREQRRRRVELVALLVAGCGAALLASRWVAVSDESEAMRNRDVVLCMDVSGSMSAVVNDVIDSYADLVDSLDGERIGFVMFDANAVTGFALTDDYDQVALMLQTIRAEVASGEPVAGTSAERSGSSLIGDGVASCVQHFDRLDEKRARTLVLASDNLVSGDSIYTLPQAVDLARAADVMVFGIVPRANPAPATLELRTQALRTRGEVLVLDPLDPTSTQVIAQSVSKQEKRALLEAGQGHGFDRVWPGGLLLVLGLAAAVFGLFSRSGRMR